MFHLGGLSLGYFTPPAKPEKKAASSADQQAKQRANDWDEDSEDRREELARAFMTPWHLFY